MADFYNDPTSPLYGMRSQDEASPEKQAKPSEPSVSPSDEAGFNYDPFDRDAYFARRASNEVRRRYNIEPGDVQRLKQYDAQVRRIYQQMKAGEWTPPPMARPRPKPLDIPFNRLERIARGMYF